MKKLTMSDFFTTFVEANWCLVIGMYLVVFIFSWAFFGTVWFAIFWLRFRFDSGVTCVDNVDSWTSAFLLSVETQTTIGYGGRQVWRSCSSPSSFLHFSCELKQARGEHEGRDMPQGSSGRGGGGTPPLPHYPQATALRDADLTRHKRAACDSGASVRCRHVPHSHLRYPIAR